MILKKLHTPIMLYLGRIVAKIIINCLASTRSTPYLNCKNFFATLYIVNFIILCNVYKVKDYISISFVIGDIFFYIFFSILFMISKA